MTLQILTVSIPVGLFIGALTGLLAARYHPRNLGPAFLGIPAGIGYTNTGAHVSRQTRTFAAGGQMGSFRNFAAGGLIPPRVCNDYNCDACYGGLRTALGVDLDKVSPEEIERLSRDPVI